MHQLHAMKSKTLRLMRELGKEHAGQSLQDLGWTFAWDQGKRRLGACHIKKGTQAAKQITLSQIYARRNGWATMEDVARHEIAHALHYEADGARGHGPGWKRLARACGADPTRLYEDEDLDTAPPKYLGVCPNACGYERGFYRRIKRRYLCPSCTDEAPGDQKAYLHVTELETERVLWEGGVRAPENKPKKQSPHERNLRDPKLDGFKYTATCPQCGHMVGYKRALKRRRACGPCCDEHSGGSFDPRFELQIRKNY